MRKGSIKGAGVTAMHLSQATRLTCMYVCMYRYTVYTVLYTVLCNSYY